MKKIILLGLCLVLCLSYVVADIDKQSYGTFKTGENINLYQVCADCTFVNITSIINPAGAFIYKGTVGMTKTGTVYNYTLSQQTLEGEYIICGLGDVGGTDTIFCYDMELTDTGSAKQDNNIIAILVVYILSIVIYLIFSVINYNLSKFKLSNISFWLMLTSAAFSIVNFVSLLFVVLFYHNNWSLTTILNINAYMTALTLFGIGVASLYVIILRLFDFTGESDNMGKWGNEKEGKKW